VRENVWEEKKRNGWPRTTSGAMYPLHNIKENKMIEKEGEEERGGGIEHRPQFRLGLLEHRVQHPPTPKIS
jgi:hypothetical protein